jgi:hypothetical protein
VVGIPPITTLVIPGGANEVEGHLVGQLRELRADEDNDSLRLHDGTKEGGYEFLNRDENDGRYQFHSPELDGFDFDPSAKGIVTRVGPGQYKIRKLTANEDEFQIDNPRGTADNFYISLLDTILSAHTWSATQTYVERIIAQDGLQGDTFGTHHGDVVGGNITGVFTGTGHGDFDGTFTGDVDVSGHQFVTDDGQILEEQIDPQAWIRRGLPLGAIVMWSGIVADIPDSFALCDGDNGTPDLRDRFIVGAANGAGHYAPGSTGGSIHASGTGTIAVGGAHDHPLSIDGHVLTLAEMPKHKHGNGVGDDDGQTFNHGTLPAVPNASEQVSNLGSSAGTVEGYTTEEGENAAHSHTGSTTSSGAHSHDLTLDDVTILPPYFALCFIMKIV